MYGLGSPDCLWAGLRQAEAAHFSRLHEVAHRTHRVLDGRVRVDPVLVVEVDHLDPEPLETGLAGLAHVVGPAVDAQKRAGPGWRARRAPRCGPSRTCRRCRGTSLRDRARGEWWRPPPPRPVRHRN